MEDVWFSQTLTVFISFIYHDHDFMGRAFHENFPKLKANKPTISFSLLLLQGFSELKHFPSLTLPSSFPSLALPFPSFLPPPSFLPLPALPLSYISSSLPSFLPSFLPSSLPSFLSSSLPSSLLFLPFASFLPPSFSLLWLPSSLPFYFFLVLTPSLPFSS